MRWIKLPVRIKKKENNFHLMTVANGPFKRQQQEDKQWKSTQQGTKQMLSALIRNTVMETLTLLINGVLFSVFATALSTPPPQNTNTHHHISGSAGSAASPLALLTNRYSNNHLPSVLSGLQPMDSSSCLRPPSPLILGALRSVTASIH